MKLCWSQSFISAIIQKPVERSNWLFVEGTRVGCDMLLEALSHDNMWYQFYALQLQHIVK